MLKFKAPFSATSSIWSTFFQMDHICYELYDQYRSSTITPVFSQALHSLCGTDGRAEKTSGVNTCIRTRAAVAGQTQSIAKTDLCLKITPAKTKALPLPAQLCIISRLWCFKRASSPGQVTDHLMLPGQARPPFCPRQAYLHLRSLSLLENPQSSSQHKAASANESRQNHFRRAIRTRADRRSGAEIGCEVLEWGGKWDVWTQNTELRCYTRPLGNYRANIKGCRSFAFPNVLSKLSFAAKPCLFSSYLCKHPQNYTGTQNNIVNMYCLCCSRPVNTCKTYFLQHNIKGGIFM